MSELESMGSDFGFNCVICGSTESFMDNYPCRPDERRVFGFQSVVNCLSCGIGRAYPYPTREALDGFYERGDYWSTTPVRRALMIHNKVQAWFRAKYVLNHVGKATPIRRVLDVGAGGGYIRDALVELLGPGQFEYDFVESDPVMADKIMNAVSSVRASRKDIATLESDLYDVVFVNHVIEHVSDPVEFLEVVSRAAAPGGYCYVEVPNRDDQFKESVFPHTFFFDQNSLVGLGERVGLGITAVRSFGDRETARSGAGRSLLNRLKSRLFAASTRLEFPALHRLLDDWSFGFAGRGDLWVSSLFKR